eukprot:scaffold508140_cov16-Prasinocladus_malaysianus.AAC.1
MPRARTRDICRDADGGLSLDSTSSARARLEAGLLTILHSYPYEYGTGTLRLTSTSLNPNTSRFPKTFFPKDYYDSQS